MRRAPTNRKSARPPVVTRLPRVPSLSWDDCRLLVDSVTDYAIFMLDATGHVATWNTGAEKINGYTASEIVGTHFAAFFTPEDRDDGKPARELELARAPRQDRRRGAGVSAGRWRAFGPTW